MRFLSCLIASLLLAAPALRSQQAIDRSAVTDSSSRTKRGEAPEVRRARIERLTALSATAREARRVAVDSVVRRELTESFDVGNLHVNTSSELAAFSRSGATSAWGELSPSLDTLVRSELDRERYRVFAVQHTWYSRAFMGVEIRATSRDEGERSSRLVSRTAAAIALGFRDELERRASVDIPAVIRSWIGNATIPLIPLSAEQLGDVRVQLGTATARNVRACLSRDNVQCRRTLMLEDRSDQPWRDVYDDDELRAVVNKMRGSVDARGVPIALRGRCLRNDVLACRELATALGASFPLPFLVDAHRSLLAEAMRAGGGGALTRLRYSSGNMGQRLEATSALPIDSLLNQWRARVEGVPARPGIPAATLAASLAWTLVAGALVAARRTRCA
ncbi:MAG: hypothetical protein ABIT38_02060 [Gemmatimonadaceae bacterium]